MKLRLSVLPITLVFIVLSTHSIAQNMLSMMRGMTGYMLLNSKEVQKELKLRPDQVKRMQEKQKEMVGAAGKTSDPSAITEAMAPAASTDAVEKSMSEVLAPDQAKRFHELLLQYNGPLAFRESSVAKELDLTAEQTSRVASIFDKLDADQQAAFMDLAKHHSPGSVKGAQKRIEEQRKAASESLLAVLTPEQTSRWEALQGTRFKFPKNLKMPF